VTTPSSPASSRCTPWARTSRCTFAKASGRQLSPADAPQARHRLRLDVRGSPGNEIGSDASAPYRPTRCSKSRSAARPDKAEFSDRLLFTLMLHEMGATQEARESWARLSQERSDLPELSAMAK
jgi:hypothetical protein